MGHRDLDPSPMPASSERRRSPVRFDPGSTNRLWSLGRVERSVDALANRRSRATAEDEVLQIQGLPSGG